MSDDEVHVPFNFNFKDMNSKVAIASIIMIMALIVKKTQMEMPFIKQTPGAFLESLATFMKNLLVDSASGITRSHVHDAFMTLANSDDQDRPDDQARKTLAAEISKHIKAESSEVQLYILPLLVLCNLNNTAVITSVLIENVYFIMQLVPFVCLKTFRVMNTQQNNVFPPCILALYIAKTQIKEYQRVDKSFVLQFIIDHVRFVSSLSGGWVPTGTGGYAPAFTRTRNDNDEYDNAHYDYGDAYGDDDDQNDTNGTNREGEDELDDKDENQHWTAKLSLLGIVVLINMLQAKTAGSVAFVDFKLSNPFPSILRFLRDVKYECLSSMPKKSIMKAWFELDRNSDNQQKLKMSSEVQLYVFPLIVMRLRTSSLVTLIQENVGHIMELFLRVDLVTFRCNATNNNKIIDATLVAQNQISQEDLTDPARSIIQVIKREKLADLRRLQSRRNEARARQETQAANALAAETAAREAAEAARQIVADTERNTRAAIEAQKAVQMKQQLAASASLVAAAAKAAATEARTAEVARIANQQTSLALQVATTPVVARAVELAETPAAEQARARAAELAAAEAQATARAEEAMEAKKAADEEAARAARAVSEAQKAQTTAREDAATKVQQETDASEATALAKEEKQKGEEAADELAAELQKLSLDVSEAD